VQKTSALAALAALALSALAALPALLAALSGLLLLLTRLLLAAALLALTAALVLLTTLILLARLLFVCVHICSFGFPPWRDNKGVEMKFLQAFCGRRCRRRNAMRTRWNPRTFFFQRNRLRRRK
jgi:hypothetical protein